MILASISETIALLLTDLAKSKQTSRIAALSPNDVDAYFLLGAGMFEVSVSPNPF
jgi:hypothetical protein